MTAPAAKADLRPATPADRAFLQRVHDSTRATEIAAAGWDDATARAFLDSQFTLQERGYAAAYPGADHLIVRRAGTDIGRLIVDRTRDALRIVDIALLPEHRGQGIGTALFVPLLDEADTAGRPVRLSVLQGNPAIRLYLRLGFTITDPDGLHIAMERPPARPAT